jgi:hypothetical protein
MIFVYPSSAFGRKREICGCHRVAISRSVDWLPRFRRNLMPPKLRQLITSRYGLTLCTYFWNNLSLLIVDVGEFCDICSRLLWCCGVVVLFEFLSSFRDVSYLARVQCQRLHVLCRSCVVTQCNTAHTAVKLNNVWTFSFYITVNTPRFYYKQQLLSVTR